MISHSIKPSYDYMPSLDGLRTCAIAFVVFGHFGFGRFIPGGFGVTLFFFISGFLITRLLLAELQNTGSISLYHFYLRRALRLYPALLLMVILSTLFYFSMGYTVSLIELISALFYFANYYSIFEGYTLIGKMPHAFSILWSLAVEEHYYLFFPLLFISFSKQKWLFIKIVISLILLILAWRLLLVLLWKVPEARTYFSTDTRADSIFYGCTLSMILATSFGEKFVAFCARPSIFFIGIIILLFCFIFRDPIFRETLRYSLQGMAFVIIIPAVLFHERYNLLKNLLQHRWFVYVGKLSYSLYLQHWFAMIVAATFAKQFSPSWYLIVLPMTLFLSVFSYHYVEKPILALRRRYGSHRL